MYTLNNQIPKVNALYDADDERGGGSRFARRDPGASDGFPREQPSRGEREGGSGHGSSNSGNNGWYTIALALVGVALIPAIWHLVSNSVIATQGFFGYGTNAQDGATMEGLTNVFAVLTAVIAMLITLFTPSKKLKSPLNYFAVKFSEKASKFKENTDPEARKQVITAMAVNAIVLVILTAAYFFIISNLISVEEGNVDGTIYSVVLKLIVIGVFLYFTSFVVDKFEEIDGSGNKTDDVETKRNIWTIGLIIGVIAVIGIGNGLATYVNDQINNNDSLNSVKEILGGENGDNGIGEGTIDIIQ